MSVVGDWCRRHKRHDAPYVSTTVLTDDINADVRSYRLVECLWHCRAENMPLLKERRGLALAYWRSSALSVPSQLSTPKRRYNSSHAPRDASVAEPQSAAGVFFVFFDFENL